jgi:hypothetical protein
MAAFSRMAPDSRTVKEPLFLPVGTKFFLSSLEGRNDAPKDQARWKQKFHDQQGLELPKLGCNPARAP